MRTACSSDLLLLADLPGVIDHDRQHQEEQDDGERRTAARLELGELRVHLVRDHRGAEVTAGHRAHDVEDLQRSDRDRRRIRHRRVRPD